MGQGPGGKRFPEVYVDKGGHTKNEFKIILIYLVSSVKYTYWIRISSQLCVYHNTDLCTLLSNCFN